MLTLLFGTLAFFWMALFTVVGLTVFLALLIPFLLLVLIFRIGLLVVKLATGVVLLALLAVCLF
jgi:hypothetical protein